jgi:hypothetical protein
VSREPFKKGVSFEVTELELEYLHKLSELEGTNIRNVLRRGIRDRAKAVGLDLPEGTFSERGKGNWLPKEDRLTLLNEQPVLIPG